MFDCKVCGLSTNKETIMESHLKGAKHMKKLRAAEIMSATVLDSAIEVTEAANTYHCRACDIILNSQMQLKAHLDGAKHQAKVGQSGQEKKTTESGLQMTSISISAGPPPPAPAPSGAGKAADNGFRPDLYCAQCNVHTNSDLQYQQHMSSQKHLSKIKMTPAAPWPGRGKPYGRPPFTNNGYAGPGYSNFRGRGCGRGRGGMGFDASGANGGPRMNHPYNGGYAKSHAGVQMYPAGFNNANFNHGKGFGRRRGANGYGNRLPTMSDFFPSTMK